MQAQEPKAKDCKKVVRKRTAEHGQSAVEVEQEGRG